MAYVKGMTQYKVEDLEHHMGPRSFIANDIVDLLEEKGYLKIGKANLFCPERSTDEYIVFWELNLPDKDNVPGWYECDDEIGYYTLDTTEI